MTGEEKGDEWAEKVKQKIGMTENIK